MARSLCSFYGTGSILLIKICRRVRFEEAVAFEYCEHLNSPLPDTIDDTIGTEKDLANVSPLQFWYHAASQWSRRGLSSVLP
jgi:hypothetical protein